MSHHSGEIDPELLRHAQEALASNAAKMGEAAKADIIRRMFAEIDTLGATGKYPLGKLTLRDEGELRLMVRSTPGKVVLEFGTPVAWIGFSPGEARQVAEVLLEHAAKAEAQTS